MIQGPSVTALTHWLTDIPGEFLNFLTPGETPDIAPVVSDLLLLSGASALDEASSASYRGRDVEADRNYLQILLYVCHVLYAPGLRGLIPPEKIRPCLEHRWWRDLSAIREHRIFIQESLRREELVRVILQLLEIQPGSETAAHAQDRLKTLDSLEEKLIEKQSQAARQRVQEIREALARKAAEEAASKMSRE